MVEGDSMQCVMTTNMVVGDSSHCVMTTNMVVGDSSHGVMITNMVVGDSSHCVMTTNMVVGDSSHYVITTNIVVSNPVFPLNAVVTPHAPAPTTQTDLRGQWTPGNISTMMLLGFSMSRVEWCSLEKYICVGPYLDPNN